MLAWVLDKQRMNLGDTYNIYIHTYYISVCVRIDIDRHGWQVTWIKHIMDMLRHDYFV